MALSNAFGEGSIMKRRHQGLKAIRRSKLPKIGSWRFEQGLQLKTSWRLDKDKVIPRLFFCIDVSRMPGLSCNWATLSYIQLLILIFLIKTK
jgi:hypothetical protein